MKSFTPEQSAALSDFEEAAESSDLKAIGYNRRVGACRHLVKCYERVKGIGVEDALTDAERVKVLSAHAFIS